MNTEGGRIANVLASAQACAAAEALARARALRSSCGPACGQPAGQAEVLPESSVLTRRVTRLLSCGVQTVEGCVPESVRIARVNACAVAAVPPNRFVPPPCPPAVYNTVVVDAAEIGRAHV